MTTEKINFKSGVIGGLVGGLIFGMMMAMMGMMPMIAMMIGSESVVVGWILHLLISAFTGGVFAVLFQGVVNSYASAVWYGVLYGIIWWVLGAIIIMPVILGMGVQFANMFDQMRIMSMMGHVVFGAVLALVAYWYTRKV
jgi:uncharacterized membrane protein YagU involved in acid resistance